MEVRFAAPFELRSNRRRQRGLRGRTTVTISLIVLAFASLFSCSAENDNPSAIDPNMDTFTFTYETSPVPDKKMTNLSRPDTVVYPGDTLLVELSPAKTFSAKLTKGTTFELDSDRHCKVKKKGTNSYYVYVSPEANNFVTVSTFLRRPNTLFRFAMKDDNGKVIDYFNEQELSCESKYSWPVDSAASAAN